MDMNQEVKNLKFGESIVITKLDKILYMKFSKHYRDQKNNGVVFLLSDYIDGGDFK